MSSLASSKSSKKRTATAGKDDAMAEKRSKILCCDGCKRRASTGTVWACKNAKGEPAGSQCKECFGTWMAYFVYLRWPQFAALAHSEARVFLSVAGGPQPCNEKTT